MAMLSTGRERVDIAVHGGRVDAPASEQFVSRLKCA